MNVISRNNYCFKQNNKKRRLLIYCYSIQINFGKFCLQFLEVIFEHRYILIRRRKKVCVLNRGIKQGQTRLNIKHNHFMFLSERRYRYIKFGQRLFSTGLQWCSRLQKVLKLSLRPQYIIIQVYIYHLITYNIKKCSSIQLQNTSQSLLSWFKIPEMALY